MKHRSVKLASALTILTLSWQSAAGITLGIRSSFEQQGILMNQTPQTDPEEIALDGDYLKAFNAAFIAFEKDDAVPKNKRRLENYTIIFSRDKKFIHVFFYAKRLGSERRLKGGQTSTGRDVEYYVSPKNFRILDRILSK